MSIAGEMIISNVEKDGILRLTLNDHARRNALSETMMNELMTLLSGAQNDQNIRVVVIAANGPAFCSGHDLKELTSARASADRGEEIYERVMKKCSALMQSMTSCTMPIIAEVDGVATAAGCQLVASCDLAYASDRAKFCTPGVNIGLFCSTPMVPLSRTVARKHAMEMLLTGNMLPAEQAASIGLVNEVVSVSELRSKTMETAQMIAEKSSATVAIGKKAFYHQVQLSLSEAYEYASGVMVDNLLSKDAEEGIEAFLKKRKPNWSDR